MDDGGEIRPSNKECNNDHLATVQSSLEMREKNNKQWLVCGFNGFGQLKFENKRKLKTYEDFHFPLSLPNHKVLVASSWNCLAIANEQSLYLQGFIAHSSKVSKSIKVDGPITSIDICDKFILVLLESGKVYKLQPDCDDTLKEVIFQTNLTAIILQKRNIFGENKISKSLKITHVACGNNITIAVSVTNAVFSGTTQIYQFPKHQQTKQLVCGLEHALLLTANGDIYAWGNGLRGQLGLEVLRVEETPTLIEALSGIKVTYIAAGGWHSAAISAFGDLYTWGFNSNGQLGIRLHKTSAKILKEPTVYPLPHLLDLSTCEGCKDAKEKYFADSSCLPLKVVAGSRHTILLMGCVSIYASGWNYYGQLGLKNSQEYCDNFQYVFKIKDDLNDKQIICGNWCTLIEQ